MSSSTSRATRRARRANQQVTQQNLTATTSSGAEFTDAARIGFEQQRPSLNSTPGPMRDLQRYGDVLPELEELEEQQRSLWRHPAMLVSVGLTLAAIITMIVLLLLGVFGTAAKATGGELTQNNNQVRFAWGGPDVPYQVIVVGGPQGNELDVSQLVVGQEVWLPLSARLIDENSCIIVRPAEGNEESPVTMNAPDLEGQGGISSCLTEVSEPAE